METKTTLSALLAPYYELPPIYDRCIFDITSDSRCVQSGDVFMASCSPLGDGDKFIPAAIARGAIAILRSSVTSDIICRNLVMSNDVLIPEISLPHFENLMGPIASAFYHHPSKQMPVIGITGTNGKTTVSFLLAQALTALQQKASVIGTLGYGPWNHLKASHLTTPMPVVLQRMFYEEYKEGTKAIAMEISSHSLAQHRVAGTQLHTAVFTNLSRDHLDYHGDMHQYGLAKKQLFLWPGLAARVINLDDAFGQSMVQEFQGEQNLLGYSSCPPKNTNIPTVYFKHSDYCAQGMTGLVVTPWGELSLKSRLLGAFNGSNLLATIAVLGNLGYTPQQIEAVLPTLQGAPGRMQVINRPGVATVVVDYAHTPDALGAALRALKQHATGKLFCVFGCGGNRDVGKRPLMAQIAAQYSDMVVVTSDNPRWESPEVIIEHIIAGLPPTAAYHVEPARCAAIQWALEQAKPLDIILIAGKGHETYQQVQDEFHHFSDEETVLTHIQSITAQSGSFHEVK